MVLHQLSELASVLGYILLAPLIVAYSSRSSLIDDYGTLASRRNDQSLHVVALLIVHVYPTPQTV